MKRLITADDVKKAFESHESLYIDNNTIVTASARDLARDKGVELIEGTCQKKVDCDKANIDKSIQEGETYYAYSKGDIKESCQDKYNYKHVEREIEKDPILTPEQIYEVFDYAIKSGMFTEEDLINQINQIN